MPTATTKRVLARLTDTLASWPDCWDTRWESPGASGITQARQRLGHEPLKQLFSQVAVPVADMLTPGATGRRGRAARRRLRSGRGGAAGHRRRRRARLRRRHA
ncbi:transposase domain-containing protein [Nonomuraea turcica]|uniref:transposase domain-containing protein n=1 Tax=Nonomuraea sp. G32 TaxID=3067274 RepID=UPI0035302F29